MPSPPPQTPRRRHPSAATRWAKHARFNRIADALERGYTLDAIAITEGLSVSRMRAIVNDVLAQNGDLKPPSAFLQLWTCSQFPPSRRPAAISAASPRRAAPVPPIEAAPPPKTAPEGPGPSAKKRSETV